MFQNTFGLNRCSCETRFRLPLNRNRIEQPNDAAVAARVCGDGDVDSADCLLYRPPHCVIKQSYVLSCMVRTTTESEQTAIACIHLRNADN